MKKLPFYLILIVVFLFGGFSGFFIYRAFFTPQKNTNSTAAPTITPGENPDTNIVPPPAQALAGTVTLGGTARIISRDQSDWQPLTNQQKVYQDERIIVDSGSLIVEFPQYLTLKTEKDIITEFTLTNLLPNSFLIKQTNGDITYETPVSISVSTSAGGLIQLDKGKFNIREDLENETSTVSLLSGSASLATIDPQNTTQVYKLIQGETIILDSSGEVTTQ